MVKNLTEGKPLNLLFFFCPAYGGGQSVPAAVQHGGHRCSGQVRGEDAVAAVGSSFPIVFLSVAVASGLSMGCNVVVSPAVRGQAHPRDEDHHLHRYHLPERAGPHHHGPGGWCSPALCSSCWAPTRTLWMTPGCTCGSTLEERCSCFCTTPSTASTTPRGGQQNAADLSHDLQPDQHRAGPALRHPVQHGVAGVAWATLIAQGMCAIASLVVMFQRMKKLPCEPERANMKIPCST